MPINAGVFIRNKDQTAEECVILSFLFLPVFLVILTVVTSFGFSLYFLLVMSVMVCREIECMNENDNKNIADAILKFPMIPHFDCFNSSTAQVVMWRWTLVLLSFPTVRSFDSN